MYCEFNIFFIVIFVIINLLTTKIYIMKKLLLSMAVISFFQVSGQNGPIDFETGGNGAAWTWTTFENATNPAPSIIANPDATGANTSAMVMSFNALQAGNPWAGCESLHGADLGSFVLSATNNIIKIMVHKPVISDVGIKLVSSNGWAQPEIKVANTLINQWEELTFDFSAYINPPASEGQLDQIVIFPDFNARTQDNVCYVDNITFSAAGSTPAEPMVAAPDPTKPAANVISMFSGVYTNVPVDTWQTSWSAGTVSNIQIAGNDTKKYSALNFVGIETVSNQIDASDMINFNIDYWTANMTELKIKLVDFGADGAFGGGDDAEHELVFTPTLNEWVTLEIPLTSFTNLTTTSNISQLILVGAPTGSSTLFVDNVYFDNAPATTNSPMVDAPAPPARDAADVISIYGESYATLTGINYNPGWGQSGTVDTAFDVDVAANLTMAYNNFNYQGTDFGQNVDASGMEFLHVDIWTANATDVKVTPINNGTGTGEVLVPLTLVTGEWSSVDLPISSFTGMTWDSVFQLKFDGQGGVSPSDIYLDNIYFWKAPLSVDDFQNSNNTIKVYPNPAINGSEIFLSEIAHTVEVYSFNGQKVADFSNTNKINLTVAKGIYMVKIQDVDGNFSTQKLIIK